MYKAATGDMAVLQRMKRADNIVIYMYICIVTVWIEKSVFIENKKTWGLKSLDINIYGPRGKKTCLSDLGTTK